LWYIGNTLDSAALLLTAALGAAIAFRAALFNLGCEGQIYAGGVAAAAVLLMGGGRVGGLSAIGLSLLAALAAVAAGAAMGALSGLLKKAAGANELITSFLLSAALSPVADYLISGPLRDTSGSLVASPRFAPALLLGRLLPPSSLSVSLVFALLLACALAFFIGKTAAGYRFRIAGASPRFARYGGIDSAAYWIPALAASGGLCGLSGYFAMAGTYGLCHAGFSGGLGWSAIACALIAKSRPLPLILAVLAFASLRAGADAALLTAGVSLDTKTLLQAAVMLFATARFGGAWARGNRERRTHV
jgi:simple sugar transport system permease protein